MKFNRIWFKGSANLLLDQILVFPMAVVLLVSLTLLFGGRCALWQWWGAVAVVLAFPFWRNDWKRAALSDLWFLFFLFALWVVSGISMTIGYWDCQAYHYPAIRMLMLGWNPIWQSTYEAIQTASGSVDGCDIWPVLSMPRPVWYFTAVANFFTRNQFDFYHPIVLIFFCSSLGYTLKLIRGTNFLIKAVSVFSVIAAAHAYDHALAHRLRSTTCVRTILSARQTAAGSSTIVCLANG